MNLEMNPEMNRTVVHTTVWGLGNPLLHDDAAGLEAVAMLRALLKRLGMAGFSLRSCELSPANWLSTLRTENPLRLFLLDASDMGLAPGSLRRFPLSALAEVSLTSHDVPLALLVQEAAGERTRAEVLAVQPLCTNFHTGLSAPVRRAAQRLAELIALGRTDEIPALEAATPCESSRRDSTCEPPRLR